MKHSGLGHTSTLLTARSVFTKTRDCHPWQKTFRAVHGAELFDPHRLGGPWDPAAASATPRPRVFPLPATVRVAGCRLRQSPHWPTGSGKTKRTSNQTKFSRFG